MFICRGETIFIQIGENLRSVKEILIGDFILIEKPPRMWDSTLNKKCPLYVEDFPYLVRVEKVQEEVRPHAIIRSMTCGNYGWDLDSIIESGARKMVRCDFKKIK